MLVERGVLDREFAPEIALRKLRDSSPRARTAPSPTRPATGASTTTSSTCTPAGGPGSASCPPSTPPCCWPACSSAPPTSTGTPPEEAEVRRLAHELYARVDWNWARDGGPSVTHGWRPETGFIPHRWTGYDEGLLLYLLGLGSPTHPLPPESYAAYCSTYAWKELYGHELLYSGPLFTHQLPQLFVDFRGLRDDFMRERDSDYFENSRRATYVQQEYARRNPLQFAGYGEHCWGFTACDGPGWEKRVVDGVERQFYDYIARGAPFGPDDGTVAPWVVVASLPFAPEIVVPTVRHLAALDLGATKRYGFKPSFNRTFADPENPVGWWVTPYHFGIDQGPVILMIENLPHRADLGHHAAVSVLYGGVAAGRASGAAGCESHHALKDDRMPTYIAVFRGINVGGKNSLPMKDSWQFWKNSARGT